MNQPQQPDQPYQPGGPLSAQRKAALEEMRSKPPMLLKTPPRPPTAWESIPGFVRFAVWVVSVLIIVQVVAVVVFGLIFLLVGGLALGGLAA